jgi:hypothetical protein
MEPSEGYTSLEAELAHLCELMDRLADRCAFEKHAFQRSYTEQMNWDLHQRYLARAGEIEVELGL